MTKRPLVPLDYRGTPRRRPFVIPPEGSPPPPEDPYLKVLEEAMRARAQRRDKPSRPPAAAGDPSVIRAPDVILTGDSESRSILSRLPVLRTTVSEPLEPSANPLVDLHQLHTAEHQTPYDAWRAVLLSGEAGVPTPPWAVSMFRDLWKRRHQNKKVDLDSEFGFSGKRGKKTSQAEQLLRARRTELSMSCIWLLTLCNHEPEQACEMEARRILADNGVWNRTDYEVTYDFTAKHNDKADTVIYRIAGSLETEWKEWKRGNTHRINAVMERHAREWLKENGEEFIAIFPPA